MKSQEQVLYNINKIGKDILFIHIPKTAGTSIHKSFLDNNLYNLHMNKSGRLRHLSSESMIKILGKDSYNSYHTFSVVRNPWDRYVSNWRFLVEKKIDMKIRKLRSKASGKKYKRAIKQYMAIKNSNFETFLRMDLEENRFGNENRAAWLVDQYKYISNEDNILVNKILRFESIKHDFYKEFKFKLTSIEINKTTREDYSYYYNNKTKNILGDFYKKDIDMFNYRF